MRISLISIHFSKPYDLVRKGLFSVYNIPRQLILVDDVIKCTYERYSHKTKCMDRSVAILL